MYVADHVAMSCPGGFPCWEVCTVFLDPYQSTFSFSARDTNLGLREFEKCGRILKHIRGPGDSNWMHILYQMGMVLGIFLGVVLAGGMHIISRLFSNNIHVLKMTYIGMPFCAATQPLNSLAFVFGGINFEASDFAHVAYSMVFVSIVTIACLLTLSPHWGFVGVWIALTIIMTTSQEVQKLDILP